MPLLWIFLVELTPETSHLIFLPRFRLDLSIILKFLIHGANLIFILLVFSFSQ